MRNYAKPNAACEQPTLNRPEQQQLLSLARSFESDYTIQDLFVVANQLRCEQAAKVLVKHGIEAITFPQAGDNDGHLLADNCLVGLCVLGAVLDGEAAARIVEIVRSSGRNPAHERVKAICQRVIDEATAQTPVLSSAAIESLEKQVARELRRDINRRFAAGELNSQDAALDMRATVLQ